MEANKTPALDRPWAYNSCKRDFFSFLSFYTKFLPPFSRFFSSSRKKNSRPLRQKCPLGRCVALLPWGFLKTLASSGVKLTLGSKAPALLKKKKNLRDFSFPMGGDEKEHFAKGYTKLLAEQQNKKFYSKLYHYFCSTLYYTYLCLSILF